MIEYPRKTRGLHKVNGMRQNRYGSRHASRTVKVHVRRRHRSTRACPDACTHRAHANVSGAFCRYGLQSCTLHSRDALASHKDSDKYTATAPSASCRRYYRQSTHTDSGRQRPTAIETPTRPTLASSGRQWQTAIHDNGRQ